VGGWRVLGRRRLRAHLTHEGSDGRVIEGGEKRKRLKNPGHSAPRGWQAEARWKRGIQPREKSSVGLLAEKVLVLNRSWMPISTTTVRDAVSMLYQDTARAVHPESYLSFDFASWRDAAGFARESTRYIHGCNWKMAIPEIIVLRRYNGLAGRHIKFSRRNIYERDAYTCQYCGDKPPRDRLTLDHVVPRSRGGKTTWTNIVLACQRCNLKKRDMTPEEADLTLLKKPVRPSWHELQLTNGEEPFPASWEAFLSALYWNQELEK